MKIYMCVTLLNVGMLHTMDFKDPEFLQFDVHNFKTRIIL